MSNSAQQIRKVTHVNPHDRGPKCVGIPLQSSVHRTATLEEGVELEDDVTVDAGSYLGKNVNVGARSHIGRGSFLATSVTVGQGTLIEPLVVVKKGIIIGSGCHITSGYISENVPDGTMMAGAPIQTSE